MNPFKKLSYKKNYYSKDIAKPLVFLCNKNLTRIGRLNPVNDLNISVNYNAADEISLSLPKYVQENKVFLYDKIEDLSVIEVKNGFQDESRYFEVGMDEKDTGAIVKSITGKELGYAELSQKLVTLDINTDADIARDDYVPTVLYNSDNKKGSLLDRLLSYAPDYEVGHVDDTVAGVQRTFSWSDSYMDACLNDICEELECIYTITVGLDENEKVIKRINIYDICYCKDCWDNMVNNKSTDMTKGDYWKNVLNGVCQTCKGTNVYDVGVDTPILLNTKNFSDDISVQVDKDSIKNCFKLKAGDDTLTNIVEGVLATSTNKIMMFSEDQTNKMSDELRAEWEAYYNKVNNSNTTKEYDNLTNLKYDIFDLVGFIKSSKMPTVEIDQGGLDDVYNTLIKGLESYDYKFYTPSSLKFSKASSGSNAVKSLVAIYIGNGYSFSVDGDSTFNSSSPDLDNDSYYVWKGTVKVYKTDDRDTYFVLSAKENGIVVEFHYGKEGQVSTKATTGKFFKIYYGNKDLLSYKSYLDQQIKYTLHDNDVTEYDERDWSKYSIERLKSFYDGYEECLSMLDKMELTIEEEVGEVTADLLSGQKSIIEKLRKNYSAYIEDISKIMYLLEDQVFSLYYCLDSEQLAEQYPPLNNSQDYYYKLQMCSSVKEALDSLINGYLIILNVYNDDGSVGVGNNPQYVGSLSSPNHGVQCLNCGSTNLQYDRDYGRYYCANKGCTAGYKKVVTYFDYAKAIYKWFNENYGKGDYFSDIEDNIRKIQTDLYIRNNFTDENYKELCSFVREDVYENSNYTSDNIVDNTRLLETARKFVDRAKQQLAIACVPQISITATVSSLLVQSEIPNEELFDDFAIGNYIRVSIDDTVYKLRIIGIKYDFENLEKVEVTFSNVTKSLFGAMSDIQSILQQASSIATSFSSVAKQAENGQVAAQKFEHIKKEGLDSSLGSVKAAKNQEIVVDDNGILCRYYNKWLNQYDDRQLKIINQNIVMTDDNWDSAKLAIGLGMYNGDPKWGVWADMLVGDLMITKDLKVINDSQSVEINEGGITLDGGAITWKNPLADGVVPQSAVSGLPDTLKGLSKDIEQLDGRIQTYSQSDDPSTSWNEDEKSKHKGDIWFNPSDGLTKRWDGTKWNAVTDSNLVVLAQSKGQIFTTQPTPPYNVGDLWIGNNESDLLRCQTPKKSGEKFDIKDWIVGVKYTDDSAWKEWTSDTGEFGKYKKEIKKQVDGKSNCTYGGATPPSNPETGDLWFCTDGSGGYGANKAYMYNGTSWKESNGVPDSVWDIADGKSSIFVVKPNKALSNVDSNFYHKNDIWILESDMTLNNKNYKAGSIMTATSDSTSFNETHWVEKVRYTDDTMAEKALSELADIGKDGIITPTEKQQIKMTVNDIKSTKKSIVKQCESYSIVSENVPLYKTYLDVYNSLISMTNSLLSDMTTTSNTPSNFNTLFSSYYTALENMTSVIEEASKKYASDVASGIKTDLQEQIDGKIETFYQSTVPTWNASENSKHIGDLWYNTSSNNIVHSGKTYSAKTNYRFNGTSWEENSIVPKDFYDAVDDKSTVYSSIPTTPQDRDLLIPGSDITVGSITYKKGKVYRYKSSDGTWNEINYTDDTALQEMLTSISADDKLSVTEKSYIKKQMDEIAKEYDSIQARAEKYGIGNTLTSYKTAYKNLVDYISPLLSKMDEVSTITKSEFDNKFSNYYTELGVANGLIDTAIQSAAEDTASKNLNAYKQEVDEFKELVDSNLSLVGVTKVASGYVYSPKIASGYLYISKDGCSVEIDPARAYQSDNPKVINVQAGNSDVFYVKRDGSAYFKGKITATSGKIQKGCIIGNWQVGDTKNTGRDGWLSCNSSFNNGVIDSGISWFIDDSEHFYNYGTVMNGVSFEYYSYGLKPESTILKFRFNSYSDAVNDKNKNCMYANVGYIGLNSTGNIDLNSTGSGNMYLNTYNNGSIYLDTHNTAGSINFMSETHCNSNLILTKPYTKLAGYNNAKTACFDLVQLTEYTSGANHVRLGSEALNTEVYGASIYLKVSSAVYVNDVPVHGSDRNIKKEISSIDEKYDTFFNKLNPVTYKFIDGQSGRFHSGFISQEVEEALIQSGLTTNDFAGFVKYNDPKTNDEKYGLRYEEFISLNTHMIQKLYKRIEFLEEKINSLVDN